MLPLHAFVVLQRVAIAGRASSSFTDIGQERFKIFCGFLPSSAVCRIVRRILGLFASATWITVKVKLKAFQLKRRNDREVSRE
ncbi:hypothetical protein D3P08_21520 [Paenibacillus nanensis]|uniref:Uncharacterized protein n=1 Tax=Paenibacillus nanensis TaxID=393251 RepID=A0A3A1UXS9_9BACL|nr:hypothetical protein D3P08_21520 [Paenibacillus nanensis]